MSVVVGIDVGGSTTKIGGFRFDGDKKELIHPFFIHATDPLSSAYGAFGKFTAENGLSLSDIDRVLMTGVGSAFLKNDIFGRPCGFVSEFESIGRGGLYLSGLENCLVVSMGTGTAIVHAKRGEPVRYLGGTGVGGGTLMGLSKLLLKADNTEHISELAKDGNLSNVDLRIADITQKNKMSTMPEDMTAANFGNVSDLASKSDIAKGILNLVFETVCVSAIFAARSVGVSDIVLTGNLTGFPFCKSKLDDFHRMYEGVRFTVPDLAPYATVIGTALNGRE
ncbi:MAG: pantothenate kinase [Clostridia bacterium]|nr:pantothenate kinase [Clostridia bacterium]